MKKKYEAPAIQVVTYNAEGCLCLSSGEGNVTNGPADGGSVNISSSNTIWGAPEE